MLKNLLIVLCALFCFNGCASTTTGGGIAIIENMPERTFNNVVHYVHLGIRVGIAQALDRNIIKQEDKPILLIVANTLRDTATRKATETTSNLLTDTVGQISAVKNYANKELLLALLEFAEGYINDRGGFTFIKQSDGSFALSDRTKKLLLAISGAIEMGINDNSSVP